MTLPGVIRQIANPDRSARHLLSPGQRLALATATVLAAWGVVSFGAVVSCQAAIAVITAFFVVNVSYKCLLWIAGSRPLPNYGMADPSDPNLPPYTIYVPMLKETPATVLNLIASITALSYPKDRLQVLLILEENDPGTQTSVAEARLPWYFETVIVPKGGPQTKPNALNVAALRLMLARTTGEKCTIYDAEDRMSPTQLLMAIAAFRVLGPTVGCVQAVLAFWNQRSSTTSAILGAEYTGHFCRLLNGLDRLGLTSPLGGTSNHFDVDALRKVAWASGDKLYRFTGRGGKVHTFRKIWDPDNLTEDATMAMALLELGYRTRIIGSFTYEEAVRRVTASYRQGRRWLGGYMQTFCVHTRAPIRSIHRVGIIQWASFNWFVGSAPLSYLLNPWMVGLTAAYLASRVAGYGEVSSFIQHLYPAPVFYPAIVATVAGNAILFGQMMVTPQIQQEIVEDSELGDENAHARQRGEQMYGRTLPLFATPLWWWVVRPASAYSAMAMLIKSEITGKPPGWDLTEHGEVDESFAIAELEEVKLRA